MSKNDVLEIKNFKDELNKLLDEESDDEDNLCQITGMPLTEHSVTLECKHHFNYIALYKEIYKQKYLFCTYDPNMFSKREFNIFRQSKKDYFIRCPYCRNIQFSILPFYEQLGLEKLYGINSLDDTLPNTICLYNNEGLEYGDDDYKFNIWGTVFKFGQCCTIINNEQCKQKYVATVKNTQLKACHHHFKDECKKQLLFEKQEKKLAKLAEKRKKEEKKEEERENRKKILDDLNETRKNKGLHPLKRLPCQKQNIIEAQNINIEKFNVENENNEECNAILKNGKNKGQKCGCKKVFLNGLCKRHTNNSKI